MLDLNPTRRLIMTAALGALALAGALPAGAQGFPTKPVTLIVPFAPGGAADVTGRILAAGMSKALGQTVVVENAGGAGGAIGVSKVKNATPDGYTIGLGHMGTHAAAVPVNAKLPYDPRKDFAYLGLVAKTPNIIFVRNDFPARDLKEFIAYARTKAGDLKMGHSGNGAASHITCVMFFKMIGAQPTYVAYRGFGQTINDIMAGNVDGSCDLVASVSGHVKGGKTRALVVAAEARAPQVPEVPTAKEAGMPEFILETWTGLYASKDIPAEARAKLEASITTALADPEVIKRLGDIGARAPQGADLGGAAMQKLVETDTARWIKVLEGIDFTQQ